VITQFGSLRLQGFGSLLLLIGKRKQMHAFAGLTKGSGHLAQPQGTGPSFLCNVEKAVSVGAHDRTMVYGGAYTHITPAYLPS
jgi:hypothetical protein